MAVDTRTVPARKAKNFRIDRSACRVVRESLGELRRPSRVARPAPGVARPLDGRA
ncbi:hypothetical protein [Actinomadura macrotermitis]|uniref:hypothetical protein n=1 Tax=Actinomadura macrotermitis TaxID=2585200 RepID=UPI001F220E84|nr:hypothetical protein [Actinomadura macrotermitis]